MDQPAPARENPADLWVGERVERWIRQVDALERQLQPVLPLLLDAASIVPGERVLDVGCGAGPATRAAADLAGADGRVTGLDISARMLATARERTPAASPPAATIDWLEADAAEWSPPAAGYDVVISRFGVMFFGDPPAAVANLAAATRSDGRFAAAVWARRDESPMFEIPYRVATGVLDAKRIAYAPSPPGAGPFSWHDDRTVTGLLEAAGWRDITITARSLELPFGGDTAPGTAARAATDTGPISALLAGTDAQTRSAVQAALTTEFADHLDDAGNVLLPATVRIVTAQR